MCSESNNRILIRGERESPVSVPPRDPRDQYTHVYVAFHSTGAPGAPGVWTELHMYKIGVVSYRSADTPEFRASDPTFLTTSFPSMREVDLEMLLSLCTDLYEYNARQRLAPGKYGYRTANHWDIYLKYESGVLAWHGLEDGDDSKGTSCAHFVVALFRSVAGLHDPARSVAEMREHNPFIQEETFRTGGHSIIPQHVVVAAQRVTPSLVPTYLDLNH